MKNFAQGIIFLQKVKSLIIKQANGNLTKATEIIPAFEPKRQAKQDGVAVIAKICCKCNNCKKKYDNCAVSKKNLIDWKTLC